MNRTFELRCHRFRRTHKEQKERAFHARGNEAAPSVKRPLFEN
jgi:hypothetical protein